MANKSSDILFQLIKSLEKSEKRNFKLYITRNSVKNAELKVIQLFDAIDKLDDYDEKVLLNKLKTIEKPQLGNLKTHLYKQLLASLRLLKTNDNLDLQLTEQLDYARILYNKGLKIQALKILERVKDIAKENHKFNYLAQVISLEKKIETLHITRSTREKAELLAQQSVDISGHIDRVTKLSNLALQLYSWYIVNGHARNEEDELAIKEYFRQSLPSNPETITDFYELLYLYQSYCWYAFIRQDFLMYYRYSQKWVDLFNDEPIMKSVETGHYIKGMHTLLNALFDLRSFDKFETTLQAFEDFSHSEAANAHDNFRIHTSVYINNARLNQHLMMGTFEESFSIIPKIEQQLEEYVLYVDHHRIMVFNYKIASLYFGFGNYKRCIDYLQRIINGDQNLRIDLQCYARLLHLMSHYELGNDDILEYLAKSVYRFMTKMQNLTVVEEEIFRFIKNSLRLSSKELKPGLKQSLSRIKHLEKNRFETRAFAYLDVISWLESKVYEKPMSEILHKKYVLSKRRIQQPQPEDLRKAG